MNYIWLGIILISFIFGALTGRLNDVVNAIFSGAKSAIEVVENNRIDQNNLYTNGDRREIVGNTGEINLNIEINEEQTRALISSSNSPIGKIIVGDVTDGNTYSDIAFVVRAISFSILIIPFLSSTKGLLQGNKYITPTSISQIMEQVIRVIIIVGGTYLALNVFNLGV